MEWGRVRNKKTIIRGRRAELRWRHKKCAVPWEVPCASLEKHVLSTQAVQGSSIDVLFGGGLVVTVVK